MASVKNEPKAVPAGNTVHIDPARIPQHTKLQIGAIFYQAFMRDYETPEFQECYRQWQQEKAARAATKEKESRP